MTYSTTSAIALALLALLALGVAAATLDDPVVVAGDGFGSESWGIDPSDEDNADAVGVPLPFQTGTGGAFAGACLSWLRTTWGMLATSLVVLLPAAYLSYRTRWLLPGVAVVGAFGGPVYLLWALLSSCAAGEFTGFDLPAGGGFGVGSGGLGGLDSVAQTAASRPSLLFGLVLGLAIVAAVGLLFASTGTVEDDAPREPEPDPGTRPDVVAVGRAAGAAADRIAAAEADVENEVYRAWVEMTDHLAVDHPESSTPAEFADAAVDAGMGADDVRELTTLFEAVRYGGEAATGAREARALAALRRIEDGYGVTRE